MPEEEQEVLAQQDARTRRQGCVAEVEQRELGTGKGTERNVDRDVGTPYLPLLNAPS